MMRMINQPFIAIIFFVLLSVYSTAQPTDTPSKKTEKPYRILTSGKQITVKSTRNIKNIMVWAASGHRIVEQRDINATSFSFNIKVSEKIFYLMIQYEGMKPFTEKIGVR